MALIRDKLKVIQLKGESASVAQEAVTAVTHGANILMIDTGVLADFEAACRALEAIGLRQQVKLAFAKGVRLQDIPTMKGRGIDILDIGSEIVDAPLLDMKLDVSRCRRATESAGEDRTADLRSRSSRGEPHLVAARAAKVLGLPAEQVLVVMRDDHICLDILAKTVDMRQLIGQQAGLLDGLRGIEGLTVREDAYVDSAGIMGLISCEPLQSSEIVARTVAMSGEIERTVLRRARVYATGFEVRKGMIEDTNSPYLLALIESRATGPSSAEFWKTTFHAIAHGRRDAAERGFGLVITTGGVGAEDKDFSVEAVIRLDPKAATPWIV